ncbi:MAG: hypothetical protein AAFR96_02035 [Planctomycetota bacterium]
MRRTAVCVCCIAVLVAAQPGWGQPEADPLPSLDDLLGLGADSEGDDASESGAETDAVEGELESELEGAGGIADAFVEAVGLMGDTADRLIDGGDTGVVTQRIQEDILKKLQQLIDESQNQSGGSSSSSSSSQQQQQQQQPSQGQQQQQQADEREGESGENTDAPAGRAAQPGEATLNTAAWGALPERLRDALLQGSADEYSRLYRSLTESYYRRLAEEASE